MDWQPVEKVAKNDKGEYQALVGGNWSPVTKVAKNDQGQYQALMDVGSKVSQIPDMPANAGQTQPAEQPADMLDKLKGAGEAALSAGTSMIAAPVGQAAGIAKTLTGGKFGTQAGIQQGQQTAADVAGAMTYQPRRQTGKDILGTVGDVASASKLAGLNPATAMELAGVSGPAVAATKQGIGKVAGATTKATKGIPGKLADLVTPMPAPEIEALAKKAEDMGIQLRPDMLSNNRFARLIGEVLEQLPLSGAKTEKRQIAFNSALSKIIGSDEKAKRITPDVFDRAMTKSGKKIGEISAQTPVALDSEFESKLNTRVKDAAKFETRDVSNVVKNYVADLKSKMGSGGYIDGETFRKVNSRIGAQIRSTSNGDLKHALYELQEDLHDALESNISTPERLAELKDARYRYAMGKIIEPLVAKAKGGDISPAGLMGAVTSNASKKTMMARGRGGEIGDLARIGQAFMKEPPSSGTGERLGTYSLMTGGTVWQPHVAAGVVGAANLYNRLGPRLTKRAISKRAADTINPPSGIVSP